MSRDREIVCLSEVLSPLTHMSGSEGNEAVLSREPVVTPAGVQRIPCLSGNQLRHVLVRAPGWRRLIDEYGLRGGLTLPQLNFLMHGGNLTEGGPAEDLRRVVDWQRLFPLGRLLGGCLPDQILEGTLKARRGVLVCRENARALRADVADAMPDSPLRPATSFVGGYQYTRGGAGKSGAALLDADSIDAETPSNLMIFAGECVIPGAMFVHGFAIRHAEPVDLGALLCSLDAWGGSVGGMAARGHGRLSLSIVSGVDAAEAEDAKTAYRDHAASVKDEAVAWLTAAFAKRAEKPAKAKGGKAKASVVAVPTVDESPSLFGGEA